MILCIVFMNFDLTCILSRITLDIPPQLWEVQTASGMGNTLLVRLLHNKLSVLINNFSRSYVSFLSPDFIAASFSILGLILFLVGLYSLISRKKLIWLGILLICPLPVLLEIPKNVTLRGTFLYTGLGSVILFGLYRCYKKFF
mgnify:FL=1